MAISGWSMVSKAESRCSLSARMWVKGIIIAVVAGFIANKLGYTSMFALQTALSLAALGYSLYMNSNQSLDRLNPTKKGL